MKKVDEILRSTGFQENGKILKEAERLKNCDDSFFITLDIYYANLLITK